MKRVRQVLRSALGARVRSVSVRSLSGRSLTERAWAAARGLACGLACGLAGVLACGLAQAAPSAQLVSPSGAATGPVERAVLRFSEAVMPLGAATQQAPAMVTCRGEPAAGRGRWIDAREWVFEFEPALAVGTRCAVEIERGWESTRRVSLDGARRFVFGTGAPRVREAVPDAGAQVTEDQLFLLRTDGPIDEATLAGRVWCEVAGMAERLPVRRVTGAERDALARHQRVTSADDDAFVVACPRPLPPGAKMRLVWGAGIAARGDARLRTTTDQRLAYRVRDAFTAELHCERERAQAPCLPVRPLGLRFTEGVPRAQALAARLRPAGGGAALVPKAEGQEGEALVHALRFDPPFAANGRYTLELPAGLKDADGRALANAAGFPAAVAFGDAPPLAKFAAAPFGVIEWTPDAALPITVRHVQGAPGAAAPVLRLKTLVRDADIIAWSQKLERLNETWLDAEALRRDGFAAAARRAEASKNDPTIATRELSLLERESDARRIDLPRAPSSGASAAGPGRAGSAANAAGTANTANTASAVNTTSTTAAVAGAAEVIGLPLSQPGYHVVELASPRLGAALLPGAGTMYVRTGVLVTNLAVHLKLGRENAAVWVTSLDRGRPVADAELAASDCTGRVLWQGRSGADGVARVPQPLVAARSCPGEQAIFVSARKAAPGGATDLAFVWNGWNRGIEPWRFALPIAEHDAPQRSAHTVFARTLVRAGETVHMKHFVRRASLAGLALAGADERPTRLRIIHEGSGDEIEQALAWQGDGRFAASQWAVPTGARLGRYRVELDRGAQAAGAVLVGGHFRVEAFRVPLVDARVIPPKAPLVAPRTLALPVQLAFMSGGAVADAALEGSALVRTRVPSFAGFDAFSFAPPQSPQAQDADAEDADDGGAERTRVVASRVALRTDRAGAATFTLRELPALTEPSELTAEATFADPAGEMQTVSTTVRLWPSQAVVGIRAKAWTGVRGPVPVDVVALDTTGKPLARQAITVEARRWRHDVTRTRVVGGFYAYRQQRTLEPLGVVCEGRTDAQGRLACAADVKGSGQIELLARTADAEGHAAQAATTVWLAGADEFWFEQSNDDRIDVLPEQVRVEPGQTARLQVRMPFREATALVSVEREGVIDTRVVRLSGRDPVVELKIEPGWSPNVFVSVLALRGRIRDLSWTSFFDWGWRTPLDWARAWWNERREYQAPTALVDLSKPSFKLGVAALEVGRAAHTLDVRVTPDRSRYRVRENARVRVQVLHAGKPAANAQIAFAAVDEGLLALAENTSWQLLEGLLAARPWGVETATAAGEVIGRRHYGRKAVAPGGDGGGGATRELFDTLLLWRAVVALDANGEATIEVPLNDSLSAFRLVAVADDGASRFGTGSARIETTQDLQLLAGLPPMLRAGDRFGALATLRNTTERTMTLRAELAGQALVSGAGGVGGTGGTGAARGARGQDERVAIAAAPITLTLAPGAAQEVTWNVAVPEGAREVTWEATVAEQGGGGATDRVRLVRRVEPAVPLSVQQATLLALDGSRQVELAVPEAARDARVLLAAQPRLGGALPGLKRYFEAYPYSCLEQRAAVAVGLHDAARWAELMAALPSHLDEDGLAAYFALGSGSGARGSDRLTAHLVSLAHQAGLELPAAAQTRMLDGLTAFVEGRIERRGWAERPDRDWRKLAALEALSRHGRAQARQLGSIALTPAAWPTSALLDWLAILQRVPGIANAAQRADEARALLRGRLQWGGSVLRFADERADALPWLMETADGNAARLVLRALEDPALRDDAPRLVAGALARQQRGAWQTTHANAWGVLALEAFAKVFERDPVTGRSLAQPAGSARTLFVDWAAQPQGARVELPLAPGPLVLQHEGTGKPWVTVQTLAAVPLTAPLVAGYSIKRSVTAVQAKAAGVYSRGDVLRVRVEVQARADMAWVVLADPVPAGATLLGSGLGRDSAVAVQGERSQGGGAEGERGWSTADVAFDERADGVFRRYWAFLPRGTHTVEYTVRLNNAGQFALPPARVEALYAPELHGAAPLAPVTVQP